MRNNNFIFGVGPLYVGNHSYIFDQTMVKVLDNTIFSLSASHGLIIWILVLIPLQ